MASPPSFGKRGVIGAPQTRTAPSPPPPPRRWRSQTVVIGAVGAIALGGVAASEWRERQCEPRRAEHAELAKTDGTEPQPAPEKRPFWCDSHSHSHGGSHGFSSSGGSGRGGGWFSGGSSSHASFGGFGTHGSGHGGG